jgi:hypothetical protein
VDELCDGESHCLATFTVDGCISIDCPFIRISPVQDPDQLAEEEGNADGEFFMRGHRGNAFLDSCLRTPKDLFAVRSEELVQHCVNLPFH